MAPTRLIDVKSPATNSRGHMREDRRRGPIHLQRYRELIRRLIFIKSLPFK
jgi:hypothetical protein